MQIIEYQVFLLGLSSPTTSLTLAGQIIRLLQSWLPMEAQSITAGAVRVVPVNGGLSIAFNAHQQLQTRMLSSGYFTTTIPTDRLSIPLAITTSFSCVITGSTGSLEQFGMRGSATVAGFALPMAYQMKHCVMVDEPTIEISINTGARLGVVGIYTNPDAHT